jgi:glycyl-tRNA synthetase
VDRLFLALLTSAYHQEMVEDEVRTVLKFHPSIAPIKAAVLPLVSNKPELTEKAKMVYKMIKKKYMAEWDTSGAIGRRYRRADESGIPFCITIDYDTLKDDMVTLRFRDSMIQSRVKITELMSLLSLEID